MRRVLGISAYYHDSAAALVVDGVVTAAAQEERFSRRKNDARFPSHAIACCLAQAGLQLSDLDAIAFYDKPIVKFARTLETFLSIAPRGWRSFLRVIPGWLTEKLELRATIRRELPGLPESCPILFTAHHQAHAASAFYPSPFDEAAILTVDGVGEYATTTIGLGRDRGIKLLKELHFPHSLGLLYSAFTAYCGFRVNSGEYKLMGLAPYGEPRYAAAIREHLMALRADGSLWLNMQYFSFLHGTTMTNPRFHRLFGGPPRLPESPIEARHLDVARSIQVVTGEVMLALARHARELTGLRTLCLAGGVALNCVANTRILESGLFDHLWIQPAPGDAGASLGAALAVWHHANRSPATLPDKSAGDLMRGALLGPDFDRTAILTMLQQCGAAFEEVGDGELFNRAASLLADGRVVGWVQGRMEFGPRALGNRSILADPRSPHMQSTLNQKIKFRESFRPFAPAVLAERAAEWFDLQGDSPYMLRVATVRDKHRLPGADGATGLERLRTAHSTIPAVTHVDWTARIQTVSATDHPRFHALLRAFESRTGCPLLVNTSFNVRGEPMVCSPHDAYSCFMRTEMDHLVIGNFFLERALQPRHEFAVPLEPD